MCKSNKYKRTERKRKVEKRKKILQKEGHGNNPLLIEKNIYGDEFHMSENEQWARQTTIKVFY